MSASLLSGIALAEKILATLKPKVKVLNPQLVIVHVGNDPASAVYVKRKIEACKNIGMRCRHLHLPAATSFDTLRDQIRWLNADGDVTGVLIQLPLPKALQSKTPLLMKELDPRKDVDGLTAYNIGKTVIAKEFEHLPPATPAAVIALLDHTKIPVRGKHVVVVGASNIVGKPLAAMLINREATVTVCQKATKNLSHHTKEADILISAVGKPGLIKKSMVKKGVVIIDVGITQTARGVKGDIDSDAVQSIAKAVTPVPGGVGPMTVACVLRNVIIAKERQIAEPPPLGRE